MITALTALLVLISLGLVVTVPVALATPGEWESSKVNLHTFQAWVGLVVVIAALMVFHLQFNNLEIIV
jgi:photosystem II core protein PsbZ